MATIRIATQRDAGAITHVHVESWRTTYKGVVPGPYLAGLDEAEREEQWREWLTQDALVFVAEADGEIVGFAAAGALREPVLDCDAELYAIYLFKHAQGRGIGTSLLKAVARSLQGRGFMCMAAWVLESNTSSYFYEKSGARVISSKQMEIGGAMLPVVAYGWPDLTAMTE